MIFPPFFAVYLVSAHATLSAGYFCETRETLARQETREVSSSLAGKVLVSSQVCETLENQILVDITNFAGQLY